MSIMTPESVFKDNTEDDNHLAGSKIGQAKIHVPRPIDEKEVEDLMLQYFAQHPTVDFYRMIRHMCKISKSKRDSKEQFQKVVEIYFTSISQSLTKKEDFDKLDEIRESMKITEILLDDFVKDGNMTNDHFKAGLAALLVSII